MINQFLQKKTFKNKRFKVIVSLYVFTYIYDLAEKFKIFHDILKDDGYLLIRVHQYKFSKSYSSYNYFQNKNIATNHFSNTSLNNLLNFHNFDVIKIERNIDGTTLIAKKKNKKSIKYERSGNHNFEIFYIKYMIFIVSNVVLFIHKIKLTFRKIFKKY